MLMNSHLQHEQLGICLLRSCNKFIRRAFLRFYTSQQAMLLSDRLIMNACTGRVMFEMNLQNSLRSPDSESPRSFYSADCSDSRRNSRKLPSTFLTQQISIISTNGRNSGKALSTINRHQGDLSLARNIGAQMWKRCLIVFRVQRSLRLMSPVPAFLTIKIYIISRITTTLVK